MRFLVDECCPRLFVRVLAELGHDVRHVIDVMAGAADDDVAAFAIEDDRLVVTLDYDFGDLVVRSQRQVPGLVLIGSDVPLVDHGSRLSEVIEAEGEQLPGCLMLIGKTRIRRRKLA